MNGKVDILGVPVDALTMDEAVAAILAFAAQEEKQEHADNSTRNGPSQKAHAIFTPNAEIMMAAQRDPGLKEIFREASMLTADGAGVVLAARLLGTPVPAKVSGIDVVRRLFAAGPEARLRFFLFGGKRGVAEKAKKRLLSEFPELCVVGTQHGYFTAGEEPQILEEINRSGANVLLVALGAPKQEQWIHEHRHVLSPRVCIGVGGILDVFAGNLRPTPDFYRNHGLEWLYRLCQEPRRYKRMLDLPRFMACVLRARIAGR